MNNNYQIDVVHSNQDLYGNLDSNHGLEKLNSEQLIPARMHPKHPKPFPTLYLSLAAPSADQFFHNQYTVDNIYANRQNNSMLEAYSNDIYLFNYWQTKKGGKRH